MTEYLTFRKFNSQEELMGLTELLDKNGIEYVVEDTSVSFDLTFSGNDAFNKDLRVKIKQTDFDHANDLLEGQAKYAITEIDNDNYLLEFTDEELLEILEKPDEWNSFDFIAAQKILKKRGVEITKDKIEELKRERLNELAQPEKGQPFWVVLGYIISLFGGILGIFIGWHLLSFKKTLPNGQRVYAYETAARKHGQKIFYFGIVCFLFWICIKIII